MAYYPQTLSLFRPPIKTTSTSYSLLWDNHAELYSLYSGVIADHSVKIKAFTSTTRTPVWRFISRGGHDFGTDHGLRLKISFTAAITGTGGIFYIVNGATTVSDGIANTTAIQSLTITPETANETWTIDLKADAASTITIKAWSAEWVGTDEKTLFPSGWRRGSSDWKATNAPIHTEGVGRLIKGPSAIATDRPICVFAHFARLGEIVSDEFEFAKTKSAEEQIWGATFKNYSTMVGRGMIPKCDTVPRLYTIDWYLEASSVTVDAQIKIGGRIINITTAGGWGTATMELTQAEHPISVVINPQANNSAYFQAVQVFRGI